MLWSDVRAVRFQLCTLVTGVRAPLRPLMAKKKQKTCSGQCRDGIVFTPYITVKGKMIYHPKGGVYKFPCSCKKQ